MEQQQQQKKKINNNNNLPSPKFIPFIRTEYNTKLRLKAAEIIFKLIIELHRKTV